MTAVLRESVCVGVWRDRQASRDRQADSNTHSKDTEGTQELPKQRGRRRVKERERERQERRQKLADNMNI